MRLAVDDHAVALHSAVRLVYEKIYAACFSRENQKRTLMRSFLK